jgi:hypothetical protein
MGDAWRAIDMVGSWTISCAPSRTVAARRPRALPGRVRGGSPILAQGGPGLARPAACSLFGGSIPPLPATLRPGGGARAGEVPPEAGAFGLGCELRRILERGGKAFRKSVRRVGRPEGKAGDPGGCPDFVRSFRVLSFWRKGATMWRGGPAPRGPRMAGHTGGRDNWSHGEPGAQGGRSSFAIRFMATSIWPQLRGTSWTARRFNACAGSASSGPRISCTRGRFTRASTMDSAPFGWPRRSWSPWAGKVCG